MIGFTLTALLVVSEEKLSTNPWWIVPGALFLRTVTLLNVVDDFIKGCYVLTV
jgi:hypothetical protein